MWRKFKKNKLGLAGVVVFLLIVLFVIFPEFTAPYGQNETLESKQYAPPQLPRFVDEDGNFHLRPFVYSRTKNFNLETGLTEWEMDKSEKRFIHLFVEGASYNFLFWESNLHLFGVKEGNFFLLGTDRIGRDIFSRMLYGGRTSLLVALITSVITLGFGTVSGLVSGFLGGKVDMVIQRFIELFLIIPSVPLGLALAAFLPPDMSPIIILVGVSVVLSVVRWAQVARQVRGKALMVREQDFVSAAQSIGASTPRILFKHILPPIYAHLIVVATLTIPQAILGEAGLSFLGFGIRPPMTSWGMMLQRAQNLRSLSLYPWVMFPGVAIMVTVLSLNFIGDALRDAADPYSES